MQVDDRRVDMVRHDCGDCQKVHLETGRRRALCCNKSWRHSLDLLPGFRSAKVDWKFWAYKRVGLGAKASAAAAAALFDLPLSPWRCVEPAHAALCCATWSTALHCNALHCTNKQAQRVVREQRKNCAQQLASIAVANLDCAELVNNVWKIHF